MTVVVVLAIEETSKNCLKKHHIGIVRHSVMFLIKLKGVHNMTFNSTDYVSENETTVLSGTVYRNYSDYSETFANFCNFMLTSKKVIQADENYLHIVPLNKISGIEVIVKSDAQRLNILCDNGSLMHIGVVNDTTWFNLIVSEISKRIG